MVQQNTVPSPVNQAPVGMMPVQNMQQGVLSGMNPMQKMQRVMQAMQNPAAFVKQVFPDIPDNIQNNPNQILQYLQQTRNISDAQIQQTMQQMPR